MDPVVLILFIVLELAILFGIAIVLIWRKSRLLQRELDEYQSRPVSEPSGFESIESGFLPYLEKSIIATRSRLELSESESAADDRLPIALQLRLEALEAEKRVTECCNDYPERQWEFVVEYFKPPAEEPEGAEDEEIPLEDEVDAEDDALAQANLRIQNLEKFRDNFFALNKELKTLESDRQRLTDKLEQLLPEAERSEDLQSLLEELTRQQDRLQNHIDLLESENSELEEAVQTQPQTTETTEPGRMDELSKTLGQQGDSISTMRKILDQVKQDPQAELIESLEKELRELEQRYLEASTCIEIMQNENDRLQDRVDNRDHRIEQAEAEKNESVADLQEQVGKQKQNIYELRDMVGDLKLEAEKSEQLQTKLEQFELSSRDMNMCIQVLEEENEFLQEQIKALLQADESSSIYDKAEEESSSEALQQQIEELKSRLQEKETEISEAETRYDSLEKEYLTLYEEAQSS